MLSTAKKASLTKVRPVARNILAAYANVLVHKAYLNGISQTRSMTHLNITQNKNKINDMLIIDLKNECRARGLKVSGKKSELVSRIINYDSQNSSLLSSTLSQQVRGNISKGPLISKSEDSSLLPHIREVKQELEEAKNHVTKIEDQVEHIDTEINQKLVNEQEQANQFKQNIEHDSEILAEVKIIEGKDKAFLKDIEYVQERLNALKTEAREMHNDVESIYSSKKEGYYMHEIRKQLNEAQEHASRLQKKVNSAYSDLKSNQIEDTPIFDDKNNGNSATSIKTQTRTRNNKKYVLSFVGISLGLGWILQDHFTFINKNEKP